MDDDVVALPMRFEYQVRYLDEHPECVLVGSRVVLIDPEGSPITTTKNALNHDQIDVSLMKCGEQTVYHLSVMFRRQDVDLFLRLAEVGQLVNLPEPPLNYSHFQKVGLRLIREQVEACRRILIEAYHGRGRDLPDGILERCHHVEHVEHLGVHRAWG
jgi:hypothetical protein